jgi:LPS-assembly protein
MLKYRPIAIILALSSVMIGQARAADATPSPTEQVSTDTMTIEAQQLEMLLDRKMRAIGDAELRQDDKAIFGDRIDYDALNEELHVVGNTRIEQKGLVVLGPELRLQMSEREGEMKEPVFTFTRPPDTLQPSLASRAPGLAYDPDNPGSRIPGSTGKASTGFARGDAKRIAFEGPDKERLYKARYTTCEAGVDDWYLRASELELDHHTETGTAKHASVEFKGVPILYTPWIDFPFNRQRKSGLLAPSFGTTTKSGVELSMPYYWNIAPNMDATIAPRYLSKRGLQLQGEFRYLEPNYFGEDNLEYLPSDNQADRDRYYAKILHQHSFGRGWYGGLHIERVSDTEYFSDMSTSIVSTSRVNLPQRGNISYSDEIWNFTGLAERYQTLDEFSFPYQRLPQFTLKGEKDWDFLAGNVFGQWTKFDRSDHAPISQTMVSAPDTTLLTGVTGSRSVLYPSISVPLARSYGYITPKFGVHYTNYKLDDANFTLTDSDGNVTNSEFTSDSRSLPIFSLDSGLYFDRDFRVVKNTYTQTLEPRLFYVYIPYRDQSRLPVFDSGEADLSLSTLFSENQFTGHDRINDANQLSLAVTTRLIDSKTGLQRLAATIGQRFYFSDRRVGLPGADEITSSTSDIVAAITTRLRNHWNVDAGWQYNTDIERSVKSNIGARYNPEPGKVLNLSYRFTRERLEQIDLSTEWPLAARWYGLARWNYSLREDRPIEGLAGVEYDAGCWQARAVMQRVSVATDEDPNYAFFFQLELGGMTSIGTSPLSLLKRSIPGYTNTSLIPDETR